MTDLHSLAEIVLQEAGYRTWRTTVERLGVICFEDSAIVGFACEVDGPVRLLTRWRALETGFLTLHSAYLREAGDKAWNVYSVFLCGGDASETEARQIRQIEENLERTRKIAACRLIGSEDIIAALLPILPLQYQPLLESENYSDRLRRRISSIAPTAASAVLDSSVAPLEVARLMGAPG